MDLARGGHKLYYLCTSHFGRNVGEFRSDKSPLHDGSGRFFCESTIGIRSYLQNDARSGAKFPNDYDHRWKLSMADTHCRTLLRSENPLDIQPASVWIYRFGINQHQIPFIRPMASSLKVIQNSVTTASLGFEYRKYYRKLRLEWQIRYQHPLTSNSSGSQFQIKPKFTFDGSLGAAYEFKNNFFVGVYWYGQGHDYNFSFRDDSSSLDFSGAQNLFFSNFDIRMGVEF